MGLIGGMARTAVVAGTATAVSNRVSRRQARRWGAQDQSAYAYEQQPQYQQAPPQYYQQAPPPAAAPGDDLTSQLAQLGQLHNSGVLSDAEFASAKAKLLGT
jgi:hypothetical protein